MYVYLDPSADDLHGPDRAPHGDAVVDFVDELRDRVRFLERELERKDTILLNMTEAMKAIAPPKRRVHQSRQKPTQRAGRGRSHRSKPLRNPQNPP